MSFANCQWFSTLNVIMRELSLCLIVSFFLNYLLFDVAFSCSLAVFHCVFFHSCCLIPFDNTWTSMWALVRCKVLVSSWIRTLIQFCTDQVIGYDDVAASDNIGVLNGTPGRQKGSKSGSQYSRRSQKWRSPISNVCNRRSPELRHSCRMWVLGGQVVRDRRGMLGDRVVYTPPKGAHCRTIRKVVHQVTPCMDNLVECRKE